jgi:hypothetical protein
MRRRRRDKRAASGAGGRERGEFGREEQYINALRLLQLGAAAVMLVGLTTATLVCAGEFKQPWLVASGGGVFLLGLLGYFAALPAARRWSRRK